MLTESRSGDKMGAHISRKEVSPMSNAEAVRKYHQKLDEFKIRPYAEEGKAIREAAARLGMSVQALFLEAVREYINNHNMEEN